MLKTYIPIKLIVLGLPFLVNAATQCEITDGKFDPDGDDPKETVVHCFLWTYQDMCGCDLHASIFQRNCREGKICRSHYSIGTADNS